MEKTAEKQCLPVEVLPSGLSWKASKSPICCACLMERAFCVSSAVCAAVSLQEEERVHESKG